MSEVLNYENYKNVYRKHKFENLSKKVPLNRIALLNCIQGLLCF